MGNPLITHVVWTLGRGGAERMVFDLARRLPAHGFDVRVIAAGGGGEMEDALREAGVPYAVNPVSGSRASALRFLRNEIATHRPMIWHTHLTPVWGGLAARLSRLHPWIATIHGYEAKLSWPARVARAIAYRSADRLVCVSEAVRLSVAPRSSVATVIPPGIDMSRFAPRERRLAGDVPELLTVSRLVPEKGIDTLFEALAGVLRPWRLTVVGDGPERYALYRRAEVLGIMPRIRFVGSVDNPAPFYRRADLFCFPSRSEGQGMSLLEAAASRLPVLTADLPAVREAFDDASAAFSRPDDPADWRRALERILARYPEALARTERAARIVRDRYSLDAMVEAHVALYRTV